MRTKSAQVTAVLANPSHSARAIVTVYDSAGVVGTVLDEASLGIGEPVIEVQVEQDIDSFRTARVTLQRQQGLRSLAPMVETGNPLFGSEPLVFINRQILIEAELQLPGITNTPSGLRETIFEGWIDEIDWAGDDLMLVCTDQSAKLRDTWIEYERLYGFAQGVNATKGLLIWSKPTIGSLPPLVLGDLVRPSTDNGHFYKVTTVVSPQSAVEPTWPTGAGATVVSGGVTFTEAGDVDGLFGTDIETVIQQVLNDNGLSNVVLEVPVSPAWAVKGYKQDRSSVMDAIQAMVDQLGWYVRFEWHAGSSSYKLTLAEPDRASVTVHKVLDQVEEDQCDELGLAAWDVRNVIRVVYTDSSSDFDGLGNPVRITREAIDAVSVAKYGRKFMEVAEDASSSIDTVAEADRLLEAIRDDLCEPTLGTRYSFPIDFYLELGDRITLPADTLRFTTAQTLATWALSHTFNANGAKTSVGLRGQAAARLAGWLGLDGSDVHQLSLANEGTPTLADFSLIGGRRIQHSSTKTKSALPQSRQLHVSATPGFTPSLTTLKAAGDSDAVDVPDLVPGKTYYHRSIPYSRNASRIVLGSPTPEESFVAGRAKAGHYDSLVAQGHYPLNGNFEHSLDDLTGNPFDHWNVTGGTWGSSGDMYWGNDAVYGNYVAIRQTGGDPGLRSNAFPVRREGGHFNVYISVRPQGTLTATRRLQVYMRFYRKSDLSDSPILFTYSVPYNVSAANVWARHVINSEFIGALAGDVNFCTIAFGKEDISSAYGWDIGDIFFCEAQQEDYWAERFFAKTRIYGASTLLPAEIFQEAWTNVSGGVGFATGWANFGSGLRDAQYMKDSMGFIHLRGYVKRSSGVGLPIFTLPAGYRPTKSSVHAVQATSAYGDVEITSAGVVQLGAGTPTYVSLDGITFDTRS